MTTDRSATFTGRVALFHGPGKPVQIVDTQWPPPGPGEVLVRIRQCAVCRSDVHTSTGRRAVATPTVLGHEIIGHIAAIGEQTEARDLRGEHLSIGDRITWAIYAHCGECFFCRHDLPQKCSQLFKYGHEQVGTHGEGSSGGMADYILLKRGTSILKLPAGISDPIATPINCAMSTAAALLREAGQKHIQDATVVVMGGGYAGLSAVAMARTMGAAKVLVGEPNTSLHARCIAFGADQAMVPEETAMKVLLAEWTEGRGADLALELAGATEAARMAMETLRIGGKLMLAGTVFPSPELALKPELAVRRCLTIQGVHNYHPSDLLRAVRFLEDHGTSFPWQQLVGQTFELSQTNQALQDADRQPGIRAFITTDAQP